MKSYDVTIQIKALCLFFHTMLSVFQNLLLVKFGSERVELYRIAFRGATKSYPPGKLSGITWTEAAQGGQP